MKRILIFFTMLMSLPIVILAQAETGAPVVDPETANRIIQILIAFTAAFPWGIWVPIGFTALGVIVGAVRLIVQLTPGDADDNWVTKYLGWIPTAVSAKTANKIVGRGALNIDAARKVVEQVSGQYDKEVKKQPKGWLNRMAGRKNGWIIVGLLSLACISSCAVVQPGGEGPTRAERLEEAKSYLSTALAAVEAVEKELPALYAILDTYCMVGDAPEWCGDDLDTLKADMSDALIAVSGSLNLLIEATDAGKIKSAEEAIQKVVQAMVQVTAVYARITIIIARHD